MRSFHRSVPAGLAFLVLLTAPTAAQNPKLIGSGRARISLDVPIRQSLLVLGVSQDRDVRLLFPSEGQSGIVDAGTNVLLLDLEGPWLLGGKKRAVTAPAQAPTRHCTDENLAGEVRRSLGRPSLQLCTWLPSHPEVSLRGPLLTYLVVLGSEPSEPSFVPKDGFEAYRPRGSAREAAAALAETISARVPGQTWWALGQRINLQTW
jgi:hypothetical protein